jgi:hypothetical protein
MFTGVQWSPRVRRQLVAWTGRGGTTAWPQRSPDLTTLNFSVWGTLETRVLFHPFLQVWKNYGYG